MPESQVLTGVVQLCQTLKKTAGKCIKEPKNSLQNQSLPSCYSMCNDKQKEQHCRDKKRKKGRKKKIQKNERASGQDFSQANYDACRYKKSATTSATTTTTTTGSWSNRKAYSFGPIPCRSKCLCYTASLVSGRHKTQRVRLELGDTVQNRVPLCILSLLERAPLR